MKHTFSVVLFHLSLKQVFLLSLSIKCDAREKSFGEQIRASSLTEMSCTVSVVTGISFIENSLLREKHIEIIPLYQQNNLR